MFVLYLELVDFALEAANLLFAFLQASFELERLALVEFQTVVSLLDLTAQFSHQTAEILVIGRLSSCGCRCGSR